MIDDCYDGKIDMILIKSISHFARNTVDFLNGKKFMQIEIEFVPAKLKVKQINYIHFGVFA